MTAWRATKARRVLAALLRIGWTIKRETGSHRTLAREGWPNYAFAFHDNEELGPKLKEAERCALTGTDCSSHSLAPAGESPAA